MDVNVADSLTLTDSAAISVTPLKVDLSDSIGVTDYQLINELLSVSLSDSITVVDAMGRLMQSTILDIELNEWVGGPSYATFGQQLPVRKELDWMTDVVNYDTGHEQRNQIWSRPMRRWPINWRAMDKAARDRLIELYHRSRGMYRTFLFRDWDDYRASQIEIDTDGVATSYQLKKRYYPGTLEFWDEDKKDIAPGSVFAPIIYHTVDGLQTEVDVPGAADQYYLNDRTGELTWGGSYPPSAGKLICTFEFYFRVRFESDTHVDLEWTIDYWRSQGLSIVEVIA
jgi:uncharacterized protein (TIGR02217 family)